MPTVKGLLNLGRRTWLAFFPVFAKPDDAFAKAALRAEEYALYKQMDPRDRDHACLVTKAVVSSVTGASDKLIRAALLHDIGKSTARYNPVERIFVHLYTPKTLPAVPRFKGLRGAWQRRLYHERYGADLILSAGGDSEVAEIVRRHHTPGDNLDAKILQAVEARF